MQGKLIYISSVSKSYWHKIYVYKGYPAGKMTLFQRWTNVENYLYDVEPTLKKGWKRKLDWRNFSDVETTLILRCQFHQPKVNVKPTLKQRRNFKSNRRTLYRRCFDVGMVTLNQRSQNNVRITLISRCRRCQPIFNQISTSKRRRMPTGYCICFWVAKFLNRIWQTKCTMRIYSTAQYWKDRCWRWIDHAPFRLHFDLGKKNEIWHHS